MSTDFVPSGSGLRSGYVTRSEPFVRRELTPTTSTGNQQFAGNGLTQSCGKCGTHRAISVPGWRYHKVMGRVGPCCPKPQKKSPEAL